MLAPPPQELDNVLYESSHNARLFEVALKRLTATSDFLDVPYEDAFEWGDIVSALPSDFQSTFYVVAFRSTVKPDLPQEQIDLLYESDEAAHKEALASGGLLKYWYASPDSTGRNLATCMWHSREDAIRAAKLPWHRKAAALIQAGIYDTWTLERYTLQIGHGHYRFKKL